MKQIRNYISINPRLKSIEKTMKINVYKLIDMEESKNRLKINGV